MLSFLGRGAREGETVCIGSVEVLGVATGETEGVATAGDGEAVGEADCEGVGVAVGLVLVLGVGVGVALGVAEAVTEGR